MIYKIEVSWYYCQSEDGRLRFSGSARQVKIDHRLGPGLNTSQRSGLTRRDNSAGLIERRESPRLKSDCDAELIADLSILDSEAHIQSPPLVFLGRAINVSLRGIGVVLPSLLLDERFCSDHNPLELSLYLPRGEVVMSICPVRCSPLNAADRGQGYFVGARINAILEHRNEFEKYLRTLSPLNANN